MSVINQVLTQLEQRGARPAPEQTMVRAVVPDTRSSFVIPLLAFGVALLGVFAAWQSAQTRKPNVAAGSVTRNQVAAMVVTPSSSVLAAPAVAVEAVPAEILLPARPSSDASTVPLAATMREVANRPVQSKVEMPVTNQACAEPCQKAQAHVVNSHASAVHKTAATVQPLKKADQPQPTPSVPANALVNVAASNGALPVKRVSPAQQADAEFRKANALMQQGRIADAMEGYEAVLRLEPGHDVARRALVALLLEGKRGADAERTLQEGLKIKPEHTGFAMLLARLQVERGAVEQAMATLEKSLPYADTQADYHAFLAALLQRQNRHKEAITHYQIALQLVPDKGVWLMGYGISLQAVQRNEDARDAYRRALDSRSLSTELQAFVQQKLKSL